MLCDLLYYEFVEYLSHFKLNFQWKKGSVDYFLTAATVLVALEAVNEASCWWYPPCTGKV